MRKKIEKIVKCEHCGTSYVTHSNNNKFCSKLCRDQADYLRNMLDYKWRLRKLVSMAKNRAKTKDLPFNITTEYMVSLWEDSDGLCEVSNIEFELDRASKGRVHPYAPSIDRIVPELGYVKGNVRLVVYQINLAISEFGLEQFEELIKLYQENSQ